MRLLKIEQDKVVNLDIYLFEKMIEEQCELADAVIKSESNARILSECMDVHQTTLNFMQRIATKEEIAEAGRLHCEKLRGRGYVVVGEYELREGGK